jgi:hypothetical protein
VEEGLEVVMLLETERIALGLLMGSTVSVQVQDLENMDEEYWV